MVSYRFVALAAAASLAAPFESVDAVYTNAGCYCKSPCVVAEGYSHSMCTPVDDCIPGGTLFNCKGPGFNNKGKERAGASSTMWGDEADPDWDPDCPFDYYDYDEQPSDLDYCPTTSEEKAAADAKGALYDAANPLTGDLAAARAEAEAASKAAAGTANDWYGAYAWKIHSLYGSKERCEDFTIKDTEEGGVLSGAPVAEFFHFHGPDGTKYGTTGECQALINSVPIGYVNSAEGSAADLLRDGADICDIHFVHYEAFFPDHDVFPWGTFKDICPGYCKVCEAEEADESAVDEAESVDAVDTNGTNPCDSLSDTPLGDLSTEWRDVFSPDLASDCADAKDFLSGTFLTCDEDLGNIAHIQAMVPGLTGTLGSVCAATCAGCNDPPATPSVEPDEAEEADESAVENGTNPCDSLSDTPLGDLSTEWRDVFSPDLASDCADAKDFINGLALTCDMDLGTNAVVQGMVPGLTGTLASVCAATCAGCDDPPATPSVDACVCADEWTSYDEVNYGCVFDTLSNSETVGWCNIDEEASGDDCTSYESYGMNWVYCDLPVPENAEPAVVLEPWEEDGMTCFDFGGSMCDEDRHIKKCSKEQKKKGCEKGGMKGDDEFFSKKMAKKVLKMCPYTCLDKKTKKASSADLRNTDCYKSLSAIIEAGHCIENNAPSACGSCLDPVDPMGCSNLFTDVYNFCSNDIENMSGCKAGDDCYTPRLYATEKAVTNNINFLKPYVLSGVLGKGSSCASAFTGTDDLTMDSLDGCAKHIVRAHGKKAVKKALAKAAKKSTKKTLTEKQAKKACKKAKGKKACKGVGKGVCTYKKKKCSF